MTTLQRSSSAKILLFVFGLFLMVVLVLPIVKFAGAQGGGAGGGINVPGGAGGSNVPDTNNSGSGNYDATIENFHNLLNINSFPELIILFTRGFLIMIGIVATMVIIYGGFRLVLSAGNAEGVATGKKAITWAVAGLVVALLAYSLVSILENLLSKPS